MKKQSHKKKYSVVNMTDLEINALVFTPHEKLDDLFENFQKKSDVSWAEGRGKKYFYECLKDTLKKEDSFFTLNPAIADTDPIRWSNFMDDCIVLAVLDCILNNQPIKLMHPSYFSSSDSTLFQINKNPGAIPDLISSIPFAP
jgi:hypothetical protein